MAEPTEIMFNHKELVELMIKKQNIHEGIWMVSVKFGMQATNFGVAPDGSDILPTAMLPVMAIGIHRADKMNNIAVDAALVNPAPKTEEQRAKPKHKH
jgi:hypothetical protein